MPTTGTDAICGFEAVSAPFARRPADVLRLLYGDALRGRVGPFCAVLARARRPPRLLPPGAAASARARPRHPPRTRRPLLRRPGAGAPALPLAAAGRAGPRRRGLAPRRRGRGGE